VDTHMLTTAEILAVVADLVGDNDEAAEYNRGAIEVALTLMGRSTDHRETLAAACLFLNPDLLAVPLP
jgi:hypothetical protein